MTPWKPLILQHRDNYKWVRQVVSEATTIDEDPDIPTIESALHIMDSYFPDRTLVAFLNRLLRLARGRDLDWLLGLLRGFARRNGIPMTQTWRVGLQIRKPHRPIPE